MPGFSFILAMASEYRASTSKPPRLGRHQFGPAVFGIVAGKEAALAAQFFGLGVHVVHELVDQRNGDLLDLRFRVGHFADQDVAAGVDAAFGVGVEHWRLVFLGGCQQIRELGLQKLAGMG